MYEKFYGLRDSPFDLTPNPQFLYPSRQHYAAVLGLYNRILSRKGFVVLTGEVGTGKTLVLRCLLEALEKKGVAHAYIFNSRLTSAEFLRYIALDLGLRPTRSGKSDLLIQLSNFLIDQERKKSTTVLVVDEAQLLNRQVLEEVRLLTNLENNCTKLLQVVLAGQPELDRRLDLSSVRQLKQRVALRVRLHPFSVEETRGYIDWRLERAGCQQQQIFDGTVVQRIHQASGGIPRVINVICENALISGYAQALPCVAPEIIDEVCRELGLGQEADKPTQNGPLAGMAVTSGRNGLRRLSRELFEALETVLQPAEADDETSKVAIRDINEGDPT